MDSFISFLSQDQSITTIIVALLHITAVSSGENKLYLTQLSGFCFRVFKKVFGHSTIRLEGNLLFTGPREIPTAADRMMCNLAHTDSQSNLSIGGPDSVSYGTINPRPKETLGTRGSHNDTYTPLGTVSYRENDYEQSDEEDESLQ